MGESAARLSFMKVRSDAMLWGLAWRENEMGDLGFVARSWLVGKDISFKKG